MMKIKYIGTGTFHSKSLTFEPDNEYEVEVEAGKYLAKTFPKRFFTFIEEVKTKDIEAPKTKPKAKRQPRKKTEE